MSVPAELRRSIWQRAIGHCEYCLIAEEDSLTPHQPDHIISEQHNGPTTLENLALACYECNHRKGPNIASVDPQTNVRAFLFDPRRDRWRDHFRLDRAHIIDVTAIGRATEMLLRFNKAERIRLRAVLQEQGRYPRS